MKILIAMQAVQANSILKKMTSDAISSIQSKHEWGLIVDSRDVSLATKWNDALEMGRGYDYTFLVNNDIICYPSTFDSIVKFMEENPQYIFVSSNQQFEGESWDIFEENEIDEHKLHWSFVACRSNELIEKFGYFDTIFERGSFVDTEAEIRARKMGFKLCRLLNSRFLHFNDSTHRFLPNYRDVFPANEAKLIEKWGPNASYKTPYNLNLNMNFHGAKSQQ